MHALLRQRTAMLHSALDVVPFLSRLLSPELTLEHYGRVLVAFQRFLGPLEQELRSFWGAAELLARVPQMPERWRAGSLENDICCVEQSIFEQGEEASRSWAFWREADAKVPVPIQRKVASLEEAFGLLYVFEGSTLGGSVIASRVQGSLGLCTTSGLAYFGGRGPWAREAWKSFLESLDAFQCEMPEGEERAQRQQAVVAKACETFQALTVFFGRLSEVSLENTNEDPHEQNIGSPARPE